MDKRIGIYRIISPSGKIYIGQSWNLYNRERKYRNGHCKTQIKLYNSIKKYGWNTHKFEVIHEFPKDITQEILDRYEVFYWEQYKNVGFDMLNLRIPGSRGKHSIETIKKMNGRECTESTRQKIRNSLINHSISQETKNKISDKITKLFSDKEYVSSRNWSRKGNKGATKGKKYPKNNRPQLNILRELILNKTLKEIGSMFNVSSSTIRIWLKEYGILYIRKHKSHR